LFAGSRYFLAKPQAIAFYAEIEAQERLWRDGDVTITETVDHALDEYFRHARRFTPRTQELYRYTLNLFRASLGADVLRIQQIACAHVQKRRTVPLNQVCRQVLQRPSIYKPTTRNALQLQFNRLARRCGLDLFGPHALRHYFATQLLLASVPIIKVSKLLGHASVKTTERTYAHILDEDLVHVTDVLV
jgi:integrase